MKRITLSFVALALTILTANAQFKKSWDFTKGLSDETIANLKADGSHWAENGNDADGNVNNWKNVGKPATDSYLTANGTVIPELEGLYFDIGSNKDNSIHIATTKLRLTRKGTKITFPKLANGQKITFVGRSANSTAGEQTDGQSIFIGGGVEGSLGTYTFVYQVVTESTDSVDVQFQLTPDAGIDFTLFQIDEGDAPEVEEAKSTTMPTSTCPVSTESHQPSSRVPTKSRSIPSRHTTSSWYRQPYSLPMPSCQCSNQPSPTSQCSISTHPSTLLGDSVQQLKAQQA